MSASRNERIVASKPSSIQPRKLARNAFHCARVTSRYHLCTMPPRSWWPDYTRRGASLLLRQGDAAVGDRGLAAAGAEREVSDQCRAGRERHRATELTDA